MLRVLHTADWHLGARLSERSRADEHAAFLDWLVDRVTEYHVDVLLIAGDVYDQANPPADARALFYGFAARLYKATGCTTLVIAGNHDSPAMLEAPRPILETLGVRVVGTTGDPEAMVLPLRNRQDRIEAWAMLVPFLRPGDLPGAQSGSSLEERQAHLAAATREIYEEVVEVALDQRQDDHALIATGHLFAQGASLSDSERGIQVGHRVGLSTAVFPECIDYVALGHLHRPQDVSGVSPVVYPGAPVAMSFAESAHHQGVELLTFEHGALTERRTIPVPRFRQLLQLAGTPDEVTGAVHALLRGETPQLGLFPGLDDDTPAEGPRAAHPGTEAPLTPGWAGVTLKVNDEDQAEVIDALRKDLSSYGYELVQLVRQRQQVDPEPTAVAAASPALTELTPVEVFRRLHVERIGSEPDEALEAAFLELQQAVEAEEVA